MAVTVPVLRRSFTGAQTELAIGGRVVVPTPFSACVGRISGRPSLAVRQLPTAGRGDPEASAGVSRDTVAVNRRAALVLSSGAFAGRTGVVPCPDTDGRGKTRCFVLGSHGRRTFRPSASQAIFGVFSS